MYVVTRKNKEENSKQVIVTSLLVFSLNLMSRNNQIIWHLLLLVEPTGLLVDSAMVLMFGVIEKVTDMDSLLNRTLESDKIWTSGRRIFCLTYPSV